MMEERKDLLKIFFKLSGVSLFSFIVYVLPQFGYIDPIFWILAYIFAFSSILDVQTYMRIKRERAPSSRFNRSMYRTATWGVIVWAIGVYIMGIIHISDKTFDPIVISGHMGFLLLFLVGFGWMWIIKKFKNPFQFFARYLSVITIVSLLLFLNIPSFISGKKVILIEIAINYPSNYFVVHLYLFIAIILVGLYLSKLGRSRLGAILSGVFALTNLILYCYIVGWKLGELDKLEQSLFLFSFIFHLTAIIPQSYWALYFGKLPMTAGVGWNKQNKKTEPS